MKPLVSTWRSSAGGSASPLGRHRRSASRVNSTKTAGCTSTEATQAASGANGTASSASIETAPATRLARFSCTSAARAVIMLLIQLRSSPSRPAPMPSASIRPTATLSLRATSTAPTTAQPRPTTNKKE